MFFPRADVVDSIRKRYPKGVRVELVYMDDPYSKLLPGEQGNVDFVDDTGTVFVKWDCGSRLGVVYGIDSIKKI